MEELSDILTRVTVPTYELTTDTIQVVLLKAKKQSRCEQISYVGDTWNNIVESLWNHLQAGLNELEDQLLCATCFYSALLLTNQQSYYLDKVSHVIQQELDLRNQGKNSPNTSHVVSLMYGLFQSAFLIKESDHLDLFNFLSRTFDLLISMAYEYSRYTYIVFKTMNSFKKLCGTSLQKHIYSYYQNLLNLVNHNWESPITGVRDLNRGIFQILVSVSDGPKYDILINEVNGFYWNKAKYLMLSEMIVEYKHDIKTLTRQYDWVEGLLYSLHRPGLVSAGADMYYALLEKIKHEDEWCEIFLQGLLKILAFSSSKATENFSNYWCLTTFKKFPPLAITILNELELLDDSEQRLYSHLYLLKQANKLNLVKKNWGSEEEFEFTENIVLSSIEHYNPQVRMLSFDIVCVSHTKLMPYPKEYELVLDYLYNNVNSDCTVLRLSMLSSLNSFLTRLQSSFINTQTTYLVENKPLLDFCTSLQKFAIYTLNVDGNYQRKITSVKLCKLIFDCFHNLPKKRVKRTDIYGNMTLGQMLVGHGCWHLSEECLVMKLLSLLKDSSDDVRENVVVLLLCHYRQQLRAKRFMNHLIEEALASMRSKFFYQTSCARSMFKLITNLLVTDPPSDTIFTGVEELFLFGFNELATEYEMKTDVVISIEVGKQLHSLISIIHMVLEVCLQNSYTIAILDNHIVKIVEMLEEISNQFSWEEVTATSSDFSKMSDMVQKMIATSGYEPSDETDLTKISGLHQIVLNCLWLNVKASCELAVLLIHFSKERNLINRCLNVITHVLETCRHKGAIEAAGAALGRAVHHLTSSPEERLSELPYALLRAELRQLVRSAGARPSTTRRGAGLPLLVHRLVASDLTKGKPLFHYLMETLLETCSNIEDTPSERDDDDDDDQRDLPKAVYIHFLTRVVTDSSLASDMMCYSASLAELAFGNLTSPHWQIRNAALQLYGALIPKLIGQKKASGCDDETVACDELRSHCPRLWRQVHQVNLPRPGQVILPRPGQVILPRPGQVNLPRPGQVNLPRPGQVNLPRPGQVILPRPGQVILPRPGQVILPRPGQVNLPRPGQVILPRPGQVILPRPGQVILPQPGQVNLPQPGQVNLPRPGQVNLPRPGQVILPRPGQVILPRPGQVILPRPGQVILPRPGQVILPRPGQVILPRPGQVILPRPGQVILPQPGQVNLPQPGQVNLPRPGQVILPRPGQVNLPRPGQVNLPRPGQVNLPRPGQVNLPRPGQVILPRPGQVNLPRPGQATCHDPDRSSCHDPDKSSCHDPDRSSCHDPDKSSYHDPDRSSCHDPDKSSCHDPDRSSCHNPDRSTCHNPDKVQAHSNLVPILNILANCARRYNFTSDMEEQKESDSELLGSLVLLLDSPLYTVRRLTAKCIFNIYPFGTIYDTIMKQDIVSENYLHGCLTLLMICYKSNSNKVYINTLREKFDVIFNNGTHSYMCRQLFEEMFSGNLHMNDINETLMIVRNNLHAPGIFVWADRRIERFVRNALWDSMPKILEVLLKHDHENYCRFVLMKITSEHDIPTEYLLQITEQLLSFKKRYHSSVIWEILYEISLRIDMKVDVTDILKYLEQEEFTYKLRFAFPFVARVTHSKNTDVQTLSKIVNSLSNPETTDVDLRYITALANNNLAKKFETLSDSVKINTIKTAVILLQDEDEDVRTLSAHFYKNIIRSDVALNPNISLAKILDSTFLHSIFSEQKKSIQSLCLELSDVINTNKVVDEHNPFANDSKNIYMEPQVVRELIDRIKDS